MESAENYLMFSPTNAPDSLHLSPPRLPLSYYSKRAALLFMLENLLPPLLLVILLQLSSLSYINFSHSAGSFPYACNQIFISPIFKKRNKNPVLTPHPSSVQFLSSFPLKPFLSRPSCPASLSLPAH